MNQRFADLHAALRQPPAPVTATSATSTPAVQPTPRDMKAKKNADSNGQPKPITCWNCGQAGHSRTACPQPKQGNGYEFKRKKKVHAATPASTAALQPISSSTAVNTNLPSSAISATANTNVNDTNVVGISSGRGSSYMHIYFAGEPYPVLADTGTEVTCMGLRVLPPNTKLRPRRMIWRATNGTKVQIIGEVTLTFSFFPDSDRQSYNILVSPDVNGIIFGHDALSTFGCEWILKSNDFRFDG
jgi:hypothetical protein